MPLAESLINSNWSELRLRILSVTKRRRIPIPRYLRRRYTECGETAHLWRYIVNRTSHEGLSTSCEACRLHSVDVDSFSQPLKLSKTFSCTLLRTQILVYRPAWFNESLGATLRYLSRPTDFSARHQLIRLSSTVKETTKCGNIFTHAQPVC